MGAMRWVAAAVLGLLVVGAVGVASFQAGQTQGEVRTVVAVPSDLPGGEPAADGTTLVPLDRWGPGFRGGYGHGYYGSWGFHPFGFIFPLFGLLFLFFLLKLVFFGGRGPRGPWGGGGREYWEAEARRRHDEWHQSSGTPTPPPAAQS
jgi:hypothetical protein